MARLASEAKGGFFATPPSQGAHIASRLSCSEGAGLTLFDPCCGEGDLLKQLADDLTDKGASTNTFGIELESGRAKEAKQKLDHVIEGGYEEVRMTNYAVSCMYLNPPYDNMKGGRRVESQFLRDLTEKRLQPGGLLIFCIPQEILKNTANVLANRFENIKVYRFTDQHYENFHQVIVFGYRREKSNSGPEARKTREKLFQLGFQGKDVLCPIDDEDGKVFEVPQAEKEITLFRDNKISEEEVASAINSSPVYSKLRKLTTPPPASQVDIKTPVLPLKLAHLGTCVAAGAVGGNMGNHIVSGSTDKIVETYDKSEKTQAQVEKMVTTVKIFSPDKGIITLKNK